jgi:hypothetical protein
MKMAEKDGLPSGSLSKFGKPKQGVDIPPPSTLFSEKLIMPARLAQQEEENGHAARAKTLVNPRCFFARGTH